VPLFFHACGTLRGMNAQVPGAPTITSSPILKVISPTMGTLYACPVDASRRG
jgi:hypothetical protein